MATYNGEKYIAEQVESILLQLGEEDELVVSDDGSIDDTIKILESFNDKRIKIFNHNRKNIKVPFFLSSKTADKFYFATRNFENALFYAKGDYIFLSDQDDVWLSEKIKTMIKFLDKDRLVISDAWIVGENLEKQYKLSKYIKYKKGFLKTLVTRGAPYGCLCAFTKNIKNSILPIPKNVLTHDFWLSLISEMKFSSTYVSEPLVLYRRHINTVSKTNNRQNSIFYVIKYRMFLLLEVLKRKNI